MINIKVISTTYILNFRVAGWLIQVFDYKEKKLNEILKVKFITHIRSLEVKLVIKKNR